MFAGLDLGTTHTKLVVLDEHGKLLHQAKSSYQNGFAETLDPEEIWTIVQRFLNDLDSVIGDGENEIYVGISAAMHSLLLVAEDGLPLTTLTTWADTRSQPTVLQWKGEDVIADIVSATGTPFHPMTPFAKLLHLRATSPELLNGAFKCIGIKEYIWFRLTGHWETDCSMAAATGMYDPMGGGWYPNALALAGVYAYQLPDIRAVTTKRMLKPELALARRKHLHLVLGGSDGCLAQIGSKAMKAGTASLTIGTSGALRISRASFPEQQPNGLFAYQLDGTHYICGGPTNNGGIVLQWWQEQVLKHEDGLVQALNNMESAAAAVPPGSEGLICLPYMGGERAPVWDADASGIFAGIRLHHTQAHFQRAIIEGICFIFKQLLQKLEAQYGVQDIIVASGGFIQSRWWVQVMADILERPLLVSKDELDASAIGAVAVAMKAAGKLSSWTDLEHLIPIHHEHIVADLSHHEVYADAYKKFQRLCLY